MTMASRIIDVDSKNAPLYVDSARKMYAANDSGAAAHQNSQRSTALARALQIIGVLQTTLDIRKLLELFSTEIGLTIPHHGLSYRRDEDHIDIALGSKATHSLSYRLVVAGKPLGQVRIFRDDLFRESEIQELEYLLCSLVYPLQNALMYSQAVQASHRDTLTGINNRSGMQALLDREIQLCNRHQQPMSLMMLDIDLFKGINDRYGHQFGDEVLRLVTNAIVYCIRTSDLVSRYGGEEFVVVLPNTDTDGAMMLAERIRLAVSELVCHTDQGEPVVLENGLSVSIGVAAYQYKEDMTSLIEKADKAMYQAKAHGRNRVVLADVSVVKPSTVSV